MPSARVVNHSGCSVTHGWSGAHCSARSSATSRPVLARPAATNVAEVGQRAQLGVDRVVAALGRADRPRRADVGRLGGQRVVPALAVDPADRVDRRQVDHVEAHRGDAGQPPGRGGEGAVPAACRPVDHRALGAGEELVPGGEERPLPVDPERVRGRRVTSSRTGCARAGRPARAPGDPYAQRQRRCRAAPRAAASPAARRRARFAARSSSAAPLGQVVGQVLAPWPASIFLLTAWRQVR